MHTIVVIQQYAYILVVAVTAYAFENGFEGGGDGLKIGCYRAQGVKMARRTVRAYNPVSRKYDGSLLMIWLKKVGNMKDICQSSGGTMLDRIRRKLRVDLTPFLLSTVQRGVDGGSHNLHSPPTSIRTI